MGIYFEVMRKNWTGDIPFDLVFGRSSNSKDDGIISKYYEESFKIMEDYIAMLDAMLEAPK